MAAPTIYKTTTTSPSLSTPKGIAVDTELRRLLICDSGNNRLVLCYIDGIKQINTYNTYNSNNYGNPSGAMYHDGYYYVCDTDNHTVVRLRARDMSYKDHFGTYGTSGSTNTKLNSPTDVTTDGRWLYVCDSGNNRVMKIRLENLVYKAKSSNINGTLKAPTGIIYKREGGEGIFIADKTNNRILKCKTDFTYIEQNNTNVTTPLHLAYYNDMVYVCNGGTGNDDIVVLASNGLAQQTTLEDTTITLSTPYGITSYRNTLIISDSGNNRITVWKDYDPRDAFTAATKKKFGGVFFDNPLIVIDVDQLIVGATQESGDVNRWYEENVNNYSVGFVEETATTSTHGDWTEES